MNKRFQCSNCKISFRTIELLGTHKAKYCGSLNTRFGDFGTSSKVEYGSAGVGSRSSAAAPLSVSSDVSLNDIRKLVNLGSSNKPVGARSTLADIRSLFKAKTDISAEVENEAIQGLSEQREKHSIDLVQGRNNAAEAKKLRNQEMKTRLKELEDARRKEFQAQLEKQKIAKSLQSLSTEHLKVLEDEKKRQINVLTEERESLAAREAGLLAEIEEMEQRLIAEYETTRTASKEVSKSTPASSGLPDSLDSQLRATAQKHGILLAKLEREKGLLEAKKHQVADQMAHLPDFNRENIRDLSGTELEQYIDKIRQQQVDDATQLMQLKAELNAQAEKERSILANHGSSSSLLTHNSRSHTGPSSTSRTRKTSRKRVPRSALEILVSEINQLKEDFQDHEGVIPSNIQTQIDQLEAEATELRNREEKLKVVNQGISRQQQRLPNMRPSSPSFGAISGLGGTLDLGMARNLQQNGVVIDGSPSSLLQQHMWQQQQMLLQQKEENNRLSQQLESLIIGQQESRLAEQRDGFERNLALLNQKLGLGGSNQGDSKDRFQLPDDPVLAAWQRLSYLPEDSPLYKLELEHVMAITKVRNEQELLTRAHELEKSKYELERIKLQEETKREHDKSIAAHKQKIELNRLALLAKQTDPDFVASGNNPSGYDMNKGLVVHIDFVLGLPKSQKSARVVYMIQLANGKSVGFPMCQTPIKATSSYQNGSKAIFASSKLFQKVAPNHNLKLTIEVQKRVTHNGKKGYKGVGWTMFDIFRPDASRTLVNLNQGWFVLPMYQGPIKVKQSVSMLEAKHQKIPHQLLFIKVLPSQTAEGLEPGGEPQESAIMYQPFTTPQSLGRLPALVGYNRAGADFDDVVEAEVVSKSKPAGPKGCNHKLSLQRKLAFCSACGEQLEVSDTKKPPNTNKTETESTSPETSENDEANEESDEEDNVEDDIAFEEEAQQEPEDQHIVESSDNEDDDDDAVTRRSKLGVLVEAWDQGMKGDGGMQFSRVVVTVYVAQSSGSDTALPDSKFPERPSDFKPAVDKDGKVIEWASPYAEIGVKGYLGLTRWYRRGLLKGIEAHPSVNIHLPTAFLVFEIRALNGSTAKAKIEQKKFRSEERKCWAAVPAFLALTVDANVGQFDLRCFHYPINVQAWKPAIKDTPRQWLARFYHDFSGSNDSKGGTDRKDEGTVLSPLDQSLKIQVFTLDDQPDRKACKLFKPKRKFKNPPWLKSEPYKPSKLPYEIKSGFDMYVDAARFLPPNSTITRVTVKFYNNDSVISVGEMQEWEYCNSQSFVEFPEYQLRIEVRDSNISTLLDATAMAVITIATIDRTDNTFKVVGETAINLFTDANGQHPERNLATVHLNSGNFQLPLLADRNVQLKLHMKQFELLRRVPCATILVRIGRPPSSGGKILSTESTPLSDWERLGLIVDPPLYWQGKYDSHWCFPTRGEQRLYNKLVDRAATDMHAMLQCIIKNDDDTKVIDVSDEKRVDEYMFEKLKMMNHELPPFLDKQQRLLTRKDRQNLFPMMDPLYQYDPKSGFRVSVDGVHNIEQHEDPVFCLYSCIPPLGYYGDTTNTKGVYVTDDWEWGGFVKSPIFNGGLQLFHDVVFNTNSVIVFDIRRINSKTNKVEPFGWTVAPVFGDHNMDDIGSLQYVRSGSFQLPVYTGAVRIDLLQQMSSQDYESVIKNAMAMKGSKQLKLLKWVSVYMRIVDEQRIMLIPSPGAKWARQTYIDKNLREYYEYDEDELKKTSFFGSKKKQYFAFINKGETDWDTRNKFMQTIFNATGVVHQNNGIMNETI